MVLSSCHVFNDFGICTYLPLNYSMCLDVYLFSYGVDIFNQSGIISGTHIGIQCALVFTQFFAVLWFWISLYLPDTLYLNAVMNKSRSEHSRHWWDCSVNMWQLSHNKRQVLIGAGRASDSYMSFVLFDFFWGVYSTYRVMVSGNMKGTSFLLFWEGEFELCG